MLRLFTLIGLLMLVVVCPPKTEYDLVIRNGTIYDGSGSAPFTGDVAVNGDTIAAVGSLSNARGRMEIDAIGLAISPGFINMLSWATDSLIADGRSQSDIRQGVTLEVFGEGWSMGPLNDKMKKEAVEQQGDIKYDIKWTTLGEYLDYLIKRGISPNIASFVGATTVRIHVLGYEDRAPNADELNQMRALVRQAMEEGALGVGSSLIYAPAFYAKTDELIELCKVASQYGGMYISHIRSEGNRLLEAVDELITVAREAQVPAEIYHLKAGGKANWHKMDEVIKKVEAARAQGLKITADMYTYPAGATGLDAAMPPWVQEGGLKQWIKRLKDSAIRERVKREMTTPTDQWENLFLAAGSPENVLLVEFKNDALKPLTGKTLAEVARMRGKSPEETARIAREAIRKALDSRHPRTLEPGVYTVILEPQAVADLLSFFAFAFDARSADEGRSLFSAPGAKTKLGEKIFDQRINLYSDPWHPELPGSQSAQAGIPAQKIYLVRNGLVENLIYSRFWAQQKGKEPTPGPVNGIMESSAPPVSVEEMIRTTARGLLGGRFWHIRTVDPRTALLTGLTRDGVWYIENGKIQYPVRNFRFNQSIIQMLAPGNVEMIGAPERVGSSEGQGGSASLLPALKVKEFHFTSQSEAV
ncbi:MAG: hypothetical protein HY314_08590 [Acidobacteria bacterium]|nr:hypothetical protein [Acidobacteriota bacterium]